MRPDRESTPAPTPDPALRDGKSGTVGASALLKRLATVPTPLIFAIAVALAVAILWREGALGEIGPAIRRADAATVAGGLALYGAGLALLCLRWHLLVRMIKGDSHAPTASEAFLTSVVINYAAPISLAVPSRAALTKRALGLSAVETGAVALWEVAADVAILGVATLLWLAVGGREADLLPDPSRGALLVAAAVVGSMIVAALLGAVAARRRVRAWERAVAALRTILAYPARRPMDGALAIATTVGYWAVQGVVLWLLVRAVADAASAALALGLVSLPVLVGLLSPVPGGAGIREALMLAVARVHGADAAATLLAALTYRIALFASIPVLYVAVRVWLTFDPGPRGTMADAAASGERE